VDHLYIVREDSRKQVYKCLPALEIIHDLSFLDDDDRVKRTLYLTEFMLKATILCACTMKR
jgi:hypothetical protein